MFYPYLPDPLNCSLQIYLISNNRTSTRSQTQLVTGDLTRKLMFFIGLLSSRQTTFAQKVDMVKAETCSDPLKKHVYFLAVPRAGSYFSLP